LGFSASFKAEPKKLDCVPLPGVSGFRIVGTSISPLVFAAVVWRGNLDFDPIEEAKRQWGLHGWKSASRGMAVVTSIMRAQQILLARADTVLKPFGLSFARYEVLMLLCFSQRGSLPLGKIGERLQVNKASVTNAVNRLEADGLVRRDPNPEDGRGTLATITTRGQKLTKRATQALNEGVFATVGLSGDELESLFDLLRELRHAAGDFV
jgi:DNA-binding MarR family transcriptional regulator